MRWGWVLAVLAAALFGLWALGLLPKREPTSQLWVISPEGLLAATSEAVLWESPSGRVALTKIPTGETWRSNPTSNQIALVLRGRGETTFPQGSGTVGPEELLLAFQGTGVEIRAQEELALLVFSTPYPRAASEEPQVPGGLLPMRVVLTERFTQPLSELPGGPEGSPVFESPTGSVWLLRLREAWAPSGTEDLVLYVVRGRLRVSAEGATQFADPGRVVVLPAGLSAELERAGDADEEVLLVGFALSGSPK